MYQSCWLEEVKCINHVGWMTSVYIHYADWMTLLYQIWCVKFMYTPLDWLMPLYDVLVYQYISHSVIN